MSSLVIFLCVSLFAPFAHGATVEGQGLAIAEEADRRSSGFRDFRADMVMILRNRNGQAGRRDMRIELLEGDETGEKSLVVFDSPSDVKGAALLTHSKPTGPDDQWLYLPAIKRVKRIASRSRSSPFMGSEFSYEDMTSPEVKKYTYRYMRDDDLDGEPVFVVERYPRSADSGYKRQVVWVDKAEYRTRRVEYYDRKDALVKTLMLSNHKKYLGKYWRATEMLMVNHETGKSTLLTWDNFRFDTGLSERDFRSDALDRAR